MKFPQAILRLTLPVCGLLLLASAFPMASALHAQQPAGAGTSNSGQTLPDNPQPKQDTQSTGAMATTGKFVGYMTKRSLFFPDIAVSPGPLSVWQKFELSANESISPASILTSAVSAGFGQWRDSPKDYGQGMEGYGKRFGSSMGRGGASSFFGTFIGSSILHEDPRFFPQSNPTLWGSVKYSAKRIFVTRSDSGNQTADIAGLIGPLGAETLANVWLPRSEQTGAKTAERYGTDLAWRFAGNMFKNYWPTLFRNMGLNRLKVVPAPSNQTAY